VRPSLDTLAREWATPAAHERAQTPRAVDHGVQLANQVSEWATPVVPNGGRTLSDEDVAAKGSTAKGKWQVDLANQVRLWSTPNAREWKGPGRKGGNHGPDGDGLPAQVMQKAGDDGSPRAVLNPRFVEALMGFAIGWTDFEPLETLSCRPKPARHSENSCAG
jgi:hypothetical protein